MQLEVLTLNTGSVVMLAHPLFRLVVWIRDGFEDEDNCDWFSLLPLPGTDWAEPTDSSPLLWIVFRLRVCIRSNENDAIIKFISPGTC